MIKSSGRQVRVRNHIYEAVFDLPWALRNLTLDRSIGLEEMAPASPELGSVQSDDQVAPTPGPILARRGRAFDVFLSFSQNDAEAVEQVARLLKKARLEPWLDRWYLAGGDPWQETLSVALASSAAYAVFVGASGVGGWARDELLLAQERSVRDRSFRVMPVLLPGAPPHCPRF